MFRTLLRSALSLFRCLNTSPDLPNLAPQFRVEIETPSVAGRRARLAVCSLILAGLCAGFAGCAEQRTAPAPRPATVAVEVDPRPRQLLELMGERLQLMHDVARWKWNHEKAITDPERERELLDELARQGTELGLAAEFTRAFFQAQFEAGKLIQEADFARWKSEQASKFEDVPDLAAKLRPEIGRISSEALRVLALLQTDWNRPEIHALFRTQATEILSGPGIDETVRETALRPLHE